MTSYMAHWIAYKRKKQCFSWYLREAKKNNANTHEQFVFHQYFDYWSNVPYSPKVVPSRVPLFMYLEYTQKMSFIEISTCFFSTLPLTYFSIQVAIESKCVTISLSPRMLPISRNNAHNYRFGNRGHFLFLVPCVQYAYYVHDDKRKMDILISLYAFSRFSSKCCFFVLCSEQVKKSTITTNRPNRSNEQKQILVVSLKAYFMIARDMKAEPSKTT